MNDGDSPEYRWVPGARVAPDGTLEFRPSWDNYRSRILQVPAFLVIIVALNVRGLTAPAGIVFVGCTTAVTLIGLAVYFRRAVTRFGPDGFLRRRFVRTKFVPSDRLGHVILATEIVHIDSRIDSSLIVTDLEGKKVAMFNGPYWSPGQIGEMAWALQKPTWQPFGPISFRQIRDRYPKAVPLMYARPYLFAFLVAFGFLGAVLILVLPFALIATSTG